MALGRGKYDDLCTHVREQTDADFVMLLVGRGNRGDGFSVQVKEHVAPNIPAMLRVLADSIEVDLRARVGH